MKQEKWITLLICIGFIMAAGSLYLYSEKNQWTESAGWSSTSVPANPTKGSNVATKKESTCKVFVCGQVKHPGVYALGNDARICDAVSAAGGFTKEADTQAVNQAKTLSDEEKIQIPTKGTVKSRKQTGKGKKTASQKEDGSININNADKQTLMTLTGIGEAKADAIIAYRTQNGAFAKTEDIMKISGIKQGVYDQIKNDITI